MAGLKDQFQQIEGELLKVGAILNAQLPQALQISTALDPTRIQVIGGLIDTMAGRAQAADSALSSAQSRLALLNDQADAFARQLSDIDALLVSVETRFGQMVEQIANGVLLTDEELQLQSVKRAEQVAELGRLNDNASATTANMNAAVKPAE